MVILKVKMSWVEFFNSVKFRSSLRSAEAITQMFSEQKKTFLEISQHPQENTRGRVVESNLRNL